MSDLSAAPQPVIASTRPFYCELRARQPIAWCRCGRSRRQPFCDGRSHIGTGFEPFLYRAGEEPEEVLLCGCKHTATPPFCDGTHNNLPGGYRSDERSEEDLARIRRVEADGAGIKRLDGRCYVISPSAAEAESEGDFRLRRIIAPSLGAEHQSQFHATLGAGESPVFGAGSSDAILLIAEGDGTVDIAGRRFPARRGDGVYVRAGESFQLSTTGGLQAFVSVLPGVDALERLAAPTDNFDSAHPQRVCGIDEAQRSEMGPRYFQMLIDKSFGSTGAAQFIGHIPKSRGEVHRHLYEEALIILSGQGLMWTEESCAVVEAGDVIFLPRKQAHSLECTHPDGMDVVGVIHPGDNPAINY
jgi:mannose-6-phosphate isomerase-like protein (cupin superfamily)/CDGSH-type Zn-finger protein